jgi:hypothetical protein
MRAVSWILKSSEMFGVHEFRRGAERLESSSVNEPRI